MNGIETLELFIIPNTTRIVFYDMSGFNGSWKNI
jgi:hypothetical protein